MSNATGRERGNKGRRHSIGQAMVPGSAITSAKAKGRTFGEPQALTPIELGRQGQSIGMTSIPLDLQRRFEQRWTARFYRPDHPDTPKKQGLERQDQHLAAPGKGKKKNPPG